MNPLSKMLLISSAALLLLSVIFALTVAPPSCHASPADPDCWFSQTSCPPAPGSPADTVILPPPPATTDDTFGPYLS